MMLCAGVLLSFGPALRAQVVTETKWLENWERKGKGRELLRKINGRWWSQDNREVTPPAKGNFFWVLDSKKGTVQFFHHRPFEIDRAESLHLFMTRSQVEAALGQPNRVFGRDTHVNLYYYASNGTKLDVWFAGEGILGEAKYDTLGQKSRPVASVERDLAGRNVFQLLAARANQANRNATPRNGAPPAVAQPRIVTVEADVARTSRPQAPAPKRIVSEEALASVAPGATRSDVLAKLGEPSGRSAITGDEGVRETFTYDLENGDAVAIRLVNGKVVKVR